MRYRNLAISFSVVLGVFGTLFFLEGVHITGLRVSSLFNGDSLAASAVLATDALLPAGGDVDSFLLEDDQQKNKGLLMFRGNKERNFYGAGTPSPLATVLWKYPKAPMCKNSTSLGVTHVWCGAGWTGQPVVWEREGGVTEIIFGAYDGAIHFVDADTGLPTRPLFQTGDIIKGSFSLDADGFPLLYGGSRDNKLRIIALDRDVPTELWALDSEELPEGIWNNDWDGNPVIVDGIMYEGGENGWFYAIELNRSYTEDGKVSVSPEIFFEYAGYNDELISLVGENLSIESSPLVVDDVVYVSNSGGRIMGFDIKKMKRGSDALVFDFWVGDDVDATMVTDGTGAIYVAVEEERFTDRAGEIGQLVKLNPKKRDPLVWNISLPSDSSGGPGGVWATPAVYGGYLYVPTHLGELLVVETETGKIVWRTNIGSHAWSSPNIVDGLLVVATCEFGDIRGFDLTDPASPELLWKKKVGGGCIESTPAIWNGNMYMSSRDGFFYKVGE